MSRERAIEACAPFLASSWLIRSFPHLIGRTAPRDGTETHFTDAELGEAIAMPASEAQLLWDIVRRVEPQQGIEIGAYVGWSTAHLLYALADVYDRGYYRLTVIDPFTESRGTPGDTEARFWANLDRFSDHGVALVRGHSPAVLPVVKPRDGWDFAFIDGAHTGDQPMQDIQGLLPCLTDDAIVVWHDAWIVPVKEAITWLGRQGWTNVELPTANRMTVSYRGDRPHWLDDIEAKAKEYTAVARG